MAAGGIARRPPYGARHYPGSSGSVPFGLPSAPSVIFSMAHFRVFQQLVAMGFQRFAAFVDLESIPQAPPRPFRAFDDAFEFGKGSLERQFGDIGGRFGQGRFSLWKSAPSSVLSLGPTQPSSPPRPGGVRTRISDRRGRCRSRSRPVQGTRGRAERLPGRPDPAGTLSPPSATPGRRRRAAPAWSQRGSHRPSSTMPSPSHSAE